VTSVVTIVEPPSGLLALDEADVGSVDAAIPIDELRTMTYATPTFHRSVNDALRTLT
jgi:hypothetical protein